MSLDTLPLTIAGRLVTRRHRRNVSRGTDRSDDAILRWPAQLRATPTTDHAAVNDVNTREEL